VDAVARGAAHRGRHRLLAHPVQAVVLVDQRPAVALPERGAVAGRIKAIGLVVALVDRARRRLRREHPAALAIVAVVAQLRPVAVGVGDALEPAVRAVGVGGVVLLQRRAVGALHPKRLAGGIVHIAGDAIRTEAARRTGERAGAPGERAKGGRVHAARLALEPSRVLELPLHDAQGRA
jgi:hypothetical protein